MKTVGIKKLRDKLSAYLDVVRQGETILVTDHDEVIAEISQPRLRDVSNFSPIELFHQRLLESGELIPAQIIGNRGAPESEYLRAIKTRCSIDLSALLAESREDR
jgi:antitoxin (DNA-binding transcriptional repressor) of toxin-antitoxin stability system